VTASDLRFLAFYLPQFHPIPENDEWWGKGFTEWTNVVRGSPKFSGHHQPHLPADLGYYDLRVPEVRQAQADLAAAHGIAGFVWYHYWFNGRRLLHRPFDEVLSSGEPGFPFCLCWANENWTRVWDGRENHLLIGQRYSDDDDRAHMRWLATAFSDPRYIRVDGRPVFLVYRSSSLPDPRRTTDRWRSEATRLGVGEPYLIRMESSFEKVRGDPTELGFDAAAEFQPDTITRGPQIRHNIAVRAYRKLLRPSSPFRQNWVYDYETLVRRALETPTVSYKRFPGVNPDWDNSARRPESGARITIGSTPALYERWVRGVAESFRPYSAEENFVFVNAWNEWAEGNHLEPCHRWGRSYLDVHRRVMAEALTAQAAT
jgi:lipopolysaccharide biosynthesis protein